MPITYTRASPAASIIAEPLTEARALEILNAMPFMVAMSCDRDALLPGVIVPVAYEIVEGKRVFTFPEQPFRVMRRISKLEYLQALPRKLRGNQIIARHYYEIATD